MVVLSNTTEQTLQPGQAITFDVLVTNSGCGESARSGGPLNLKCGNAVYELFFKTNLTGPTAAVPLQMSIALGGLALPETTMIYTPAAADAVGSVATKTYVKTLGDNASNQVTVINSGTNPITIPARAAALTAIRKG